MKAIKIAWRNILRHKRRSIVTFLTIITGVCSIVLSGGFFEANYIGLRESVIRGQYGHLQIYKKGYNENHRQEPDKYRINKDNTSEILEILEFAPHVDLYSRRVEITGLVGNDQISQAAIIRGVDPDAENLINSSLTIIDGTDLSEDEPDRVMLGEGLAQALNAKPGSRLSIMATTSDGMMNGVDVEVSGIFRSFAKEYDDRAMFMTLEYANILLNSQSIDHVAILLDETKNVGGFLGFLSEEAKAKGIQIETKTWDQLATFYHKVVSLYDSFFIVINIIVVIVILFGVTNTMMMSVMDRITEIGVLRALGTRQKNIVWLFIIEGLLVGLLGCLLGVGLAYLISSIVNGMEIMMPPPPGSSKGYPLRIVFVPYICFTSGLMILAVSFISSYFPSRKASKKEIVDALRHV